MDQLLVVSVGPVQEFIAAARRTRDLWAGSIILSAMSRRAAGALQEGGAELIFPPPETVLDSAIDKGDAVANIILAVCRGAVDGRVEELARKAEQAVWSVWEELGTKITGNKDIAGYIQRERFRRQLSTGAEIYWAHTDLEEGGYGASRGALMHLLGARKALRQFDQFAGEAQVPKSSLDGARETVLAREVGDEARATVRLKLRMHKGEQLDALGLVKRAGVATQHFPSIPRIAADPWLRGLRQADPEGLAALAEICGELSREGVEWMSAINGDKFREMAEVFPYEANVVFRSRLENLKEEGAGEGELAKVRQALGRLEKANKAPNAYAAVLVADGDHMGKALGAIDSYERHQEFSRQLAGFAKAAEATVKRHYGCPVFAGGDDVLAFVPVDTAIECAEALRNDFKNAMGKWGVTLSVGIGVGHNLEAMEDLLTYAKGAEKAAKNGKPERNALAIHFYPRNGQPIAVRRQWDTGIVQQLQRMVEFYLDNHFPDGAAYEIRELARHYKRWDSKNAHVRAAMLADARRVLGRKASTAAAGAQIGALLESRLEPGSTGEDLEALAEQMLVARRFTDAYRQSRRRPGVGL